MDMNKQFIVDTLHVEVCRTRKRLGEAAARDVGDRIRSVLDGKPSANIVFASAPSQSEFYSALLADTSIPWERINAFHIDEYIGLPDDAPQAFGNFLRERLWGHVKLKSANIINGNSVDTQAECTRYGELLHAYPIDIVCFGIGENGHLGFNDPPVADFNDPAKVKIVELDPICRQQQVNDGCFQTISDVPTHALTLTIPALISGRFLYCMVPGKTKAEAISHTLLDEISESCPATILRRHPDAFLYTDVDSTCRLPGHLLSVS